MIEAIKSALRAVEDSGQWTLPRRIVPMALALAGIPAEKTIEGCNKFVALIGPYAIKCGNQSEIAASRALAERLGDRFAKIHATGRCWMIQERVEHVEPDAAFSRHLRRLGVYDSRGNTGRRKDGTLCVFDGVLKATRRDCAPSVARIDNNRIMESQ